MNCEPINVGIIYNNNIKPTYIVNYQQKINTLRPSISHQKYISITMSCSWNLILEYFGVYAPSFPFICREFYRIHGPKNKTNYTF